MSLENELKKLYDYQNCLNIYQNPIIKCLIDMTKSIPAYGLFVSLGDNVVSSLLIKAFAKKFKIVVDEILNSDKAITMDMLNDIDSIQSFRQMMMLVDKTNVDEKVILFARLYKNSYITDDRIVNDEYEEYLQLLDELSFREIDLLIIYDQYFGEVDKREGLVEESSQFKQFMNEVRIKYSMERNEVIDIMTRLYCKGLCFYQLSNYSCDIGEGKESLTTEYFKKFAKRISGK